MFVPRGGFLLPSSRVPGGRGWFWVKLIPALLHNANIGIYDPYYICDPSGYDLCHSEN